MVQQALSSSDNENLTCLEQKARFSQSALWQYQKSYFDKKGINAWINELPYYVSSNAVIAYSYAHTAFNYYQDALQNGLIQPEERFYIVEVGAGSGRFSHHFLTFFNQLIERYATTPVNYCYVMTDFTNSNIDYWQQHERLRPLVKRGVLDFALYDIMADTSITLKNQKITLSKGSCKNPIIAFANYVFDAIPQDVFRVEKQILSEGLVTSSTDPSNIVNETTLKHLNKLKTQFEFNPIDSPYYDNEHLNKIVAYYKNTLKKTTFLMPIAGIHCIDFLRTLSDGKLLLLTTDKGYTHIESLEGRFKPHIAFHGSVSMMVNFDALARYTEYCGSDSLLATATEGIKISLFCYGTPLTDMPRTRWSFDDYLQRFCSKEFLLIKNKLIDHLDELTLTEILALMKLSHWDPDVLVAIASTFSDKLHNSHITFTEELREGLAKAYDHFYYIPGYKNPVFAIAQIYHALRDFKNAQPLYEESLIKYGKNAATYVNLGVCQFYLKESALALRQFKKALELEPNNRSAQEWIKHIRERT